MTESLKQVIADIGRQIGAECVRRGILDPTPEQINGLLIAICQRNIELASAIAYREKPWANPIIEAMAIEIYASAHMNELLQRTA